MTALQIWTIVALAVPTLAIVLWPLWRRRGSRLPVAEQSSDRRLELEEEKTAVYRALKELEFDYEAGHLSEDDYRTLCARYEARAATALHALDALAPTEGPRAPRPVPRPAPASGRRGWTRHPVALTVGGVLVLLFGVILGASIGRFTEPEAASPGPGSPVGPLPGPMASRGATIEERGAAPGPATGGNTGTPLPPEVLAGMLGAARESLRSGQYQSAISAYQAVLQRDARNVDAMTHMGLIVAIGGHADQALETFDKALGIDPNYAPAYLYRGEVLYEVKQDYRGAIKAWERFLTLQPDGQDRERVVALIADAKRKQSGN